jgi:pimeloyl-ACP methyl ester carboxylesterase
MSTPAEPATPTREWAHYTEPTFDDVDGLRTALRRKGSGDPLLYLHGAALTRMWLPFHETLSQTFDVVAPEHPGYGDTPTPAALRDFTDLVLHYDALIDRLGLDGAHLVGQGFGGWIAAELAVFFPRRFRTITLITPSGVRTPGVKSIDTFRMTPEETRAAAVGGDPARYAEFFEQDETADGLVKSFTENASRARVSWNPRYDRALDHRLARVRVPTLVLAAQEDRTVPTQTAARFAELVPGAQLETISGGDDTPTGHLLQIEQPDALAARIAQHAADNR